MSSATKSEAKPAPKKSKKPLPMVLIVTSVLSAAVVALMILMPVIWKGPYDTEAKAFEMVHFIGRFHPVVLHLPIGMLILVALMEVFNMLPGANKRLDTRMPLFFSAVTAVQAVVFGFLLYHADGTNQGEAMQDHLWGGIGFGCLVVGCFVAKIWAHHGVNFLRWALAPLVFVSCAVMGWAAHEGAGLVHGPKYLVEHAPDWVPDWAYKALGDGSPRPEPAPLLPPSELPVFAHVVTPILEEKCNYCHNDDKSSGKLKMHTFANLMKGGAEGPVTLVPGDVEASLMISRIHIPIDDDPDDEHMPPKEKDQLEDYEIQLLEYWVANGAPENKTLVEMEAPAEIIAASNNILSAEQREIVEAAAKAEAARIAAEKKAMRERFASVKDAVNTEYPGLLNYKSVKDPELYVSTVSLRSKYGDADLAKLEPIAEGIESLNLLSTSVTDASLPLIEKMDNLKILNFGETGITDAAADTIVSLSELEVLNLYGTKVTDKLAERLKEMTKLRKVYFWGSEVTVEAAQSLQDELREPFPDPEPGKPRDPKLPVVDMGSEVKLKP